MKASMEGRARRALLTLDISGAKQGGVDGGEGDLCSALGQYGLIKK